MIDYRFYDEQQLLVVCQSGVSDLDEVNGMRARIRKDPRFARAYDVIVDISRLSAQFDMTQMQTLAESRESESIGFRKLALISGANELAFGVLRQYVSFADQFANGLETKVFREVEQALIWLEKPGFDFAAVIEEIFNSGS